MNENHRLIKDVSNALGFYMDRTRREEGFDLSGILRPAYDLNQFKFNKLFGYSTGYDMTMKKALMPQLCLPKSVRPESEEIQLREKFYKDELKYHMRFDRNNQRKQVARSHSQKGFRSKSNSEFVNSHSNSSSSCNKFRGDIPKKQRPKVPAGLLTIRSTHTPALTKREKLSMVNITSKIMSASSELCFQKEDILLMKSLADAKCQNTCYVRKSLSQSKRDEKEEYERRLLNRHRDYERQMSLKNKKTNESSSSRNSNENNLDNSQLSYEADNRNKEKSLCITPVKETTDSQSRVSSRKEEDDEAAQKDKRNDKQNQDKLVVFITPLKDSETDSDRTSNFQLEEVDKEITKHTREINNLKQLKNLKEITDGDITKYRIVIKTGDRLGSSTEATIKLRLFGSNGKSKQFKLKDSKTHKIPFRKGNTDVFDLELFEIGPIKAVHIGHNEKNIESSWFIDYIGVENQTKNIIYTFETPDWFSTTSGDGQTSRVLFKQNSTSIDSNSSENSSDSDSSSTSSKASTLKLSAKRSIKSSSKKSFSSSSSSSLHRSSTPQSTRKSSKHSDRGSVSPPRNNKASSERSSRRSSPSVSIHNASDEIASQKFEESPRLDYVATSSLSKVVNLSLFEAVEMNRLDVIKEKLQMSPLDITKTDVSGRTLLIKACEDGFEGIIKYLADNSDELISMDTPLGYFPVHVCAEGNKLDCLKILYDYGASLQSKTNLGNTPLHLASENGHYEIVQWLVEHNVNVTIFNNNAETAYELAKRNGHIQIANYLAEPSGIKTLISIDDYSKSPFSRPDEPLPTAGSASSKSNSKTSSRQSSKQKRKSSSSSSSTSSSSSGSDSDTDKGSKHKKAESSIRVENNEYRSLVVNRSLNKSKLSSKSRSRSNSSTESDQVSSRSSSKKSAKKSPSLLSNSSESLNRRTSPSAKTHSRQNSDSNSRLTSARSKSGSESSSNTSNDKINQLKDLKEVTSGNVIKYRVICKTKENDDSNTEESVKFRIFGSIGKSKQFMLKDWKKNNKPAFLSGKTDVFDIETYDVGLIKAIYIGHSEKKIDWLIDYIGMENQTKNILYTFDKPDFFSSASGKSKNSQYLFKANSTAVDTGTSGSSDSDSDSSSQVDVKSNKRRDSTSTVTSRRSTTSKSTTSKSPVITKRILKRYEASSSTNSSDTEAELQKNTKAKSLNQSVTSTNSTSRKRQSTSDSRASSRLN